MLKVKAKYDMSVMPVQVFPRSHLLCINEEGRGGGAEQSTQDPQLARSKDSSANLNYINMFISIYRTALLWSTNLAEYNFN